MTGSPARSRHRTPSATVTRCSRWPLVAGRERPIRQSSGLWRPTWSAKRSSAPSAKRNHWLVCLPRASSARCRRASSSRLNLPLALLIVYSTVVIGLGIWTARFVRSSSAFFVAGRSLGPGLILSSMLAANIGAGSTLGATGLAYRDGLSAWWWVGSAGLGSLIFGAIVAPRLWTLAKAHDFYTTGDHLEFRYG